ncbi:MAG: urease accessory protein UreE [Candidatus Rokubacteria bacterium]|nr:urease accessory protein UreE [Candidatus Rokubacteria bacterium]
MNDAPVVTATRVHVHDDQLARLERDRLVLSAEERRWGRRRVKTEKGRELVLALPTGSVLEPGHVLHVDRESYVVIEAAVEAVLVISPRDRDEMVRVAFEVGNRHFTVAIDGDRLLVPDDVAMEQLLERIGVPWKRDRAVFAPLGAGHRHDH